MHSMIKHQFPETFNAIFRKVFDSYSYQIPLYLPRVDLNYLAFMKHITVYVKYNFIKKCINKIYANIFSHLRS